MLPFTPISFVKKNCEETKKSESDSDDESIDCPNKFNSAEYYNKIISQPECSKTIQPKKRRKKQSKPPMDPKDIQKQLHDHIANDDATKMKYLLSKQYPGLESPTYKFSTSDLLSDSNGCNIAMYCVSYKSYECLKYLLKYLPHLCDEVDSFGNSFHDIVQHVDDNSINKIVSSHQKPAPQQTLSMVIDTSYCAVCDVHHQDPEHTSSIAHVFNENRPVVEINTHLPPDNVGYKIMSNAGWHDTDGLGPSGSGRKYLIKTTLKTDRRGLGVPEKNKPRVTHFQPNDEAGIADNNIHKRQVKMKTEDKKKQKKNAEKSRQWEINLRREMSGYE